MVGYLCWQSTNSCFGLFRFQLSCVTKYSYWINFRLVYYVKIRSSKKLYTKHKCGICSLYFVLTNVTRNKDIYVVLYCIALPARVLFAIKIIIIIIIIIIIFIPHLCFVYNFLELLILTIPTLYIAALCSKQVLILILMHNIFTLCDTEVVIYVLMWSIKESTWL
jgi:hypothetical protein